MVAALSAIGLVGTGAAANASTQVPGSAATDTNGTGTNSGHAIGSGAWVGGVCGGTGCKVPIHCSATGQPDPVAVGISQCELVNMGGGTDMTAPTLGFNAPYGATAGVATATLPFGSVEVCWTVSSLFLIGGTTDYDAHCTPQVDLPI
jgi:hypothetical protein